jgi:hypothetical protein
MIAALQRYSWQWQVGVPTQFDFVVALLDYRILIARVKFLGLTSIDFIWQ